MFNHLFCLPWLPVGYDGAASQHCMKVFTFSFEKNKQTIVSRDRDFLKIFFSLTSLPWVLNYYTMSCRIIVRDAGFELGSSAPEVWCATNEPPHLQKTTTSPRFRDIFGGYHIRYLLAAVPRVGSSSCCNSWAAARGRSNCVKLSKVKYR